MHAGRVKFFDTKKGWGFIIPDAGGPEVYVHHTGIKGDGYRELHEGDLVEYDTAKDPVRTIRAVDVRVLTSSSLKRFHD